MVLIRISQIFQKIILKTSQIFGINHIYCRCDEKESYNVQVNSQIIHSYSQYGEDLVIDGIFGAKNKGYYIDIGANDPILFTFCALFTSWFKSIIAHMGTFIRSPPYINNEE